MVCLPITNGSWKARWESMCVVGGSEEKQQPATAVPEVKNYRYSMRMSSKMSAPSASTPREIEAEKWRAEGGFRRGEVNATRSGALDSLFPIGRDRDNRTEETRFLIGQAAEWLELDSPVEGIRFDSELVLSLSSPMRCTC